MDEKIVEGKRKDDSNKMNKMRKEVVQKASSQF
jgi:hypothetical protein